MHDVSEILSLSLLKLKANFETYNITTSIEIDTNYISVPKRKDFFLITVIFNPLLVPYKKQKNDVLISHISYFDFIKLFVVCYTEVLYVVVIGHMITSILLTSFMSVILKFLYS